MPPSSPSLGSLAPPLRQDADAINIEHARRPSYEWQPGAGGESSEDEAGAAPMYMGRRASAGSISWAASWVEADPGQTPELESPDASAEADEVEAVPVADAAELGEQAMAEEYLYEDPATMSWDLDS
eukprot:gene865-932_t